MPGDALLSPVPWAAAGLILVNDLYLSVQWPGPVTWVLSGFGACFLFPAVLVAAWEWARVMIGRPGAAGPGAITVACLVTAAYAAGLELSPLVDHLHETVLSTLFPWAMFQAQPDLSDLLALVSVPAAFAWLIRRR